MNFELGWREVSIALFAIAQHFSLFTLHFSLPAGTTFYSSLFTLHFPQGPLFTLHFSLFTFHFPQGLLFTSLRDAFPF